MLSLPNAVDWPRCALIKGWKKSVIVVILLLILNSKSVLVNLLLIYIPFTALYIILCVISLILVQPSIWSSNNLSLVLNENRGRSV